MGKNAKDFQSETAKHIAEYWGIGDSKDCNGNVHEKRRYLLADEVGLGKTIVASEVLQQFSNKMKDRPHKVFYICGNLNLVKENEKKLLPKTMINTSKYQRKDIRAMKGRLALLPIIDQYERVFNTLLQVDKAIALIIWIEEWNIDDCFTKNRNSIRNNKGKEVLKKVYLQGKSYVNYFINASLENNKDNVDLLINLLEGLNNASRNTLRSDARDEVENLLALFKDYKLIVDDSADLKDNLNRENEIIKQSEKCANIYDEIVGIRNYPFQSLTPLTSMSSNRLGNFEERLASAFVVCKQGCGPSEDLDKLINNKLFWNIVFGEKYKENKTKQREIKEMVKSFSGGTSQENRIFSTYEVLCKYMSNITDKFWDEELRSKFVKVDDENAYKEILASIRQKMAGYIFSDTTEHETEILAIVDEFQNYADFFHQPDPGDKTDVGIVAKALLHNEKNYVLLLSATPFHYSRRNTQEEVKANTGEVNIDDQVESILTYVMGEECFDKWCNLCKIKAENLEKGEISDAIENTKAIESLMKSCGISRMERRSKTFKDRNIYIENIDKLKHDFELKFKNTTYLQIEDGPKDGDVLWILNSFNMSAYVCSIYIERDKKLFIPNEVYLDDDWLDDAVSVICESYSESDIFEDENNNEGPKCYKYRFRINDDEDLDLDGEWEYCDEISLKETPFARQYRLPLGYLKDTPWLSSFDSGYKTSCEQKEIRLNSEAISQYREVDSKHARYSSLKDELLCGSERLLFIPPSMPYYSLKGVFENYDNSSFFSKTLIFSRYKHTPRALASMLSYESEQKNNKSSSNGTLNTNSYKVRARYGLDGGEWNKESYKTDRSLIEREFEKAETIWDKYEGDFCCDDKATDFDQEENRFRYGALTSYFYRFYQLYKEDQAVSKYWVLDCAGYLYSVFQTKEAKMIMDGLYKNNKDYTYQDMIHRYCAEGCIFAVLDEYIELLREAEEEDDNKDGFLSDVKAYCKIIAEYMRESHPLIVATTVDPKTSLYLGYADGNFDDSNQGNNGLNKKLLLFNSPFRPFVFATTSVGAEGFDFHKYCRHIVHWCADENPEKMQQKEGRIDRFHCHYIRQNLAKDYGEVRNLKKDYTIWEEIYKAAENENTNKVTETKGLFPHWEYYGRDGDKEYSYPDRAGYYYPASRESLAFYKARKSVEIYRSLLGSSELYSIPREELSERLSEELGEDEIQKLSIDLSVSRE